MDKIEGNRQKRLSDQQPAHDAGWGGVNAAAHDEAPQLWTDQDMWDALVHNQAEADGHFYYGVRTTGIYCRPSCPSRIPIRSHVVYFCTQDEALAAGFRPCKRCRPDADVIAEDALWVDRVLSVMDQETTWRRTLSDTARQLGITAPHLSRVFRKETGLTPQAYMDARRIRAAKRWLWQTGAPIEEIAQRIGFDGTSAFHTFFSAHVGMTPTDFRRGNGQLQFPSSAIAGYGLMDTAMGRLVITDNGSAITSIRFVDILPDELMHRLEGTRTPLIERTEAELAEYLEGKRKTFSIPFKPEGTPFQQAVWEILCTIPYGETRTYQEVAALAGNAGASRAVGVANNRNPILLLIPCHRVIGSNGALVGYAGGVDLKEKLLRLEREGHLAT